jgi:1-deoxy-D-xylulose-5-phosphate reductoisomerase
MSEHRIRRRLIVLGSTGSIGVNTLAVVEHLRDACCVDFEVTGLAAGTNAAALSEQAKRFGVRHVAIADEAQARSIRDIDHPHVGRDAAPPSSAAATSPWRTRRRWSRRASW